MNGPSTFALMPLGLLYGAGVRARAALYGKGLLSSFDLGVPVLSVGNITTGGTGKTPVVARIAGQLSVEGLRVCVLTRGYGREDEGKRVVVSDGARILASAEEGGDEPRLLAEMLRGTGAAVISDRDRVAAARWARENLQSEAFVLDDGFQHLRVRRELDIVTVDGTNPFGNGHLLPRGRLREPPSSLRRADLIIITRSEQAADVNALKRQLERLCGRKKVLLSRTRTASIRPLTQGQAGLSAPSSYRVAAFCALGNPQAFFTHLERTGFDLTYTRAFRDHHAYTQSDVAALAREAAGRGAEALLTTAKDAVKLRQLRFDLPCFVVEIELVFEDEATLRGLLHKAMQKGKN